ncbi:MAG: hypothetical protein ABL951_00060 [Alphaproteobacteria bacterium]
MNIPEVFYKFCQGLHQDAFDDYGPEPQDLINGALGFVQKKEYGVLRDFLATLLGGNSTDAELNDIYNSTDRDIAIRGPRGVRPFLELALKTIGNRMQ